MERAMVEAIGLPALTDAPAVPSSFKVRGHDRVTLGHDVGRRGAARWTGSVQPGVPAKMAGVGRKRLSREHGWSDV